MRHMQWTDWMGRVSGILRRNKIVWTLNIFLWFFVFILFLYFFVFINCFPPINHRGSGPVILLAQQKPAVCFQRFQHHVLRFAPEDLDGGFPWSRSCQRRSADGKFHAGTSEMESELRIDGGKGSQQIPSQDNHDQCMARYVVNVHLLIY